MKNIFLVDCDETLLDFAAAERQSLEQTLVSNGIVCTEQTSALFHEINAQLWRRLERGEIKRERLIVLRFEMLLEELGTEGDAKALSDGFFEGIAQRGIWLDGAKEFLQALKRLGRVYIVTNGARYTQKKRFSACGLDKMVDGIFISEEVGYYKPAAEYAEYVEKHIPGYRRENAVWIGDSVTSDMACAATKQIDFLLFSPCGRKGRSDGYSYEEILSVVSKTDG